MMFRLMLGLAVLSCVIAPIALSADQPHGSASTQSAPTSLAPIYVKIIWPDDPAVPASKKNRPVIESWITKSIVNRNKSNFRAVTGWVSLADGPFEATELWNGNVGAQCHACEVVADIFERKDGVVKINFRGWTPFGSEAILELKDEPGSREVVPVTQINNKHGMPHVAIFIGL